MIRTNKRGFTLLEILIVVVILGVVAGLALPAYFSTIEKSRAQEAISSLSATRQAMIQYYSENGTYLKAVLSGGDGVNTFNISYDPNSAAGGQTLLFSYALSNLGANTFTVTATRVGGPVGTVAMNQAGVITKTGVYA